MCLNNKKENICIEFDGKQHYEPVNYFGGEEKFKLRQKLDIIKNHYAQHNGFLLLRISYKKFNEIKLLIKKKLQEN